VIGVFGKDGYRFTDKDSKKSIFLPAAGYRYYPDGTLYNVGSLGNYWSSTAYGTGHAYYLYFYSGGADWHYDYRRSGLSVRAVAE